VKTYSECIPCFFRQILGTATHCGASEDERISLSKAAAAILEGIDDTVSPPENAFRFYRQVTAALQHPDPYRQIREHSNREAMKAAGELSTHIAQAEDQLLKALFAAIAGNIIDFGAKADIDVSREIARIVQAERSKSMHESEELFSYTDLLEALSSADSRGGTLLYLGDNAGEIVFDKMLIGEITRRFPAVAVTYAVRGEPVLNDVVIGDAQQVGMESVAEVISSGSVIPGTVPQQTTADFRKRYAAADIVISKGQGNFESLTEYLDREVFFLFMAKCPVIATYLNCEIGDIILTRRSERPTAPAISG